jgi:class 3 adenylate cyclase/tetratricopeptide (TPR) repeat protein
MEIAEWLRGLGLPQYERAFREHDVTPDLLPHLTVRDLKDLGIASVGHRRRLIEAIRTLGKVAGRFDDDDAVVPVAERRRLSAVFCDLVGSTELSTQLEPEDLNEIIRTYQMYVQDIMTQYGGFTARYVGDGMLVYFGWPEARETDAEQAVRASLVVTSSLTQISVKKYPLRVRVGIATGIAIIGELIGRGESRQLEAIGETLNRAARLQGLAEPNTVVIDEATHTQIGDLFQYTRLGAVHLRGLPAPEQAWVVLGESNVQSRFEALRGAQLAPLVNRVEEFSQILQCWQEARAGSGRVVMLTGEPGIGKSRLVAEVEDRISWQPHVSLHFHCSPHYEDTALHPVVLRWERSAGIAASDLPAERLRKLEVAATAAELTRVDIAMLAGLLSIPLDERYPQLDFSAQRRREATFEALLRNIENVARRQPLLIIFDDIHWIDPSSLELLEMVIRRIESLPVLLLATYRTDFLPPWVGDPLVTTITLNRLDRRHSAELVEHIAADSGLPQTLRERIVVQTDGIPLFTEELTRAIIETSAARGALLPLSVPNTLQTSLMARLDRLPAAKQVAQIAAVIGRDFSLKLLAAIAEMSPADLMHGLDELVASGLAARQDHATDIAYSFKHALVQETAYQSLLRSRRSAIHAAIVIAASEPSAVVPMDPALLGYHAAQARLYAKAVSYYRLAGERSAEGLAAIETRTQLERGLQLCENLIEGLDRRRLEAELLIGLGRVQIATKGQSDVEASVFLTRAAVLVRDHDAEMLARALFPLGNIATTRVELQTAEAIGSELLGLGEQTGDTGIAIAGHVRLGIVAFYQGRFLAARDSLSMALDLHRSPRTTLLEVAVGSAPDTTTQYLSGTLAYLGYPEQAIALAEPAIERARALGGNSFAVATILTIWSRTLMLIGDDDRCRECTESLVAIANEQGFPLYAARGRSVLGWLHARQGNVGEGLGMLSEGLEVLHRLESRRELTFINALMADGLAWSAQYADAMRLLDESLAFSAQTGGRWFDAELHRRKADLFLMGPLRDAAAAEHELLEAIETARGQAARPFELRAAMTLARLWLDTGRRADANALLAPIYASFTEGFATPDLVACRSLLCETVG